MHNLKYFVGIVGLEPTRHKALAPKASGSAQFPHIPDLVESTRIELVLEACKATVLTVITKAPMSRKPDSNRRPGDYKSPALPAELFRQIFIEVHLPLKDEQLNQDSSLFVYIHPIFLH